MRDRSSKPNQPVDTDQLAEASADQATGQEEAPAEPGTGKNPAAVALGRLGGVKGGPARAAKLSQEQRSAIARKAALARWRRQAQ